MLQAEASVAATYCLLGFSTFAFFVLFLGQFQTIAPRHVPRLFAVFPRVMINANIGSFLSICVATVLAPDSYYHLDDKAPDSPQTRLLLLSVLGIIPGYESLMNVASF